MPPLAVFPALHYLSAQVAKYKKKILPAQKKIAFQRIWRAIILPLLPCTPEKLQQQVNHHQGYQTCNRQRRLPANQPRNRFANRRSNNHSNNGCPGYAKQIWQTSLHKSLSLLCISKKFHGTSKNRVLICSAKEASSVLSISYSRFSPFISPLAT